MLRRCRLLGFSNPPVRFRRWPLPTWPPENDSRAAFADGVPLDLNQANCCSLPLTCR
jgi:hypothetical protein